MYIWVNIDIKCHTSQNAGMGPWGQPLPQNITRIRSPGWKRRKYSAFGIIKALKVHNIFSLQYIGFFLRVAPCFLSSIESSNNSLLKSAFFRYFDIKNWQSIRRILKYWFYSNTIFAFETNFHVMRTCLKCAMLNKIVWHQIQCQSSQIYFFLNFRYLVT